MAQQVLNFVTTTLRAPVGLTDTQLQLAPGSGPLFDPITTGNWCYITVNDSVTVEVMKYTSAGVVVNDTITVQRAQDGTTTKQFPVGSCVAIGWNVGQVVSLIQQNTPTSTNIQTINGPSNQPTGAPPTGIQWTVNLTTGQLWYYVGSGSWLQITANGVQITTTAPTTAPPGGIIWTVNITNNGLYFWDGVGPWRLVSGGSSGYFYEVYSRQYLDNTGVALSKGVDYPIGGDNTGATESLIFNSLITFPAQCLYKSNPAISDKIVLETTLGAQQDTMLFPSNAVVQLTGSFFGNKADGDDVRAQLTIFHQNSGFSWQNEIFVPATTGNTAVSCIVTTTPFQVVGGDHWDMNLTIIDGGASYGGFTLKQLSFAAMVMALI